VRGTGFLAIWSDIAAESETDYLHWLAREHTTERLSVSGFLAVRVFRAMRADCQRYFILYELEDPKVVGSADYLARLNAPTPWSQRIMPILGNFRRGGGTVIASLGIGQGSYVLPLRLKGLLSVSMNELAAELSHRDSMVAVRLLQSDPAQTSIQTNEKGLRNNDDTFDGLFVAESSRSDALTSIKELLGPRQTEFVNFQADAAATYVQVFALSRDLLGRR
jgi:predicted lipid-binding transport protein (Tim44 family)